MDYCRSHYSEIVYINFLDEPDKKELFEGNLTADSLLSRLRLVFPSLIFSPGKTVFFFDEAQECPRARYAAKPLMLDGRYDLIESGSLLGLRGYNRSPADILVGFEHCLTMAPMDFEEFLWAKGVGKILLSKQGKSSSLQNPWIGFRTMPSLNTSANMLSLAGCRKRWPLI